MSESSSATSHVSFDDEKREDGDCEFHEDTDEEWQENVDGCVGTISNKTIHQQRKDAVQPAQTEQPRNESNDNSYAARLARKRGQLINEGNGSAERNVEHCISDDDDDNDNKGACAIPGVRVENDNNTEASSGNTGDNDNNSSSNNNNTYSQRLARKMKRRNNNDVSSNVTIDSEQQERNNNRKDGSGDFPAAVRFTSDLPTSVKTTTSQTSEPPPPTRTNGATTTRSSSVGRRSTGRFSLLRPGAFVSQSRALGVNHAWRRGIANRQDQQQEQNDENCSNSESLINDNGGNLVTAYLVENQSIVEADVVPHTSRRKQLFCFGSVVLVLVIVVVVLVAVLWATIEDDSSDMSPIPSQSLSQSPTSTPISTLETVMERGVLVCGVGPKASGFSNLNEVTGQREGFDVDNCRAVAAAVLGDKHRLQTIELTWEERFIALANGTIDLLSMTTTHNMERDVYEPSAKVGFSFTVPYLYDGVSYGGNLSMVQCADKYETIGKCEDLKICVEGGTTNQEVISYYFPGRRLKVTKDYPDSIKKFNNSECNVIATGYLLLSEVDVKDVGYIGLFNVSTRLLSKEPLCMVTRDDDYVWSQFVNLVLQAQFAAEAMNITQANAEDFPKTNYFDKRYERMFIDAIKSVGNYGERYDRYLQARIPRGGLNLLNLNHEYVDEASNTSLGLIYSHPLGDIGNNGSLPTTDSRIHTIYKRGKIRCGITSVSPGFAIFDSPEWTGLDVDYCIALAASIFNGVTNTTVEYVNVTGTGSPSSSFDSLADGSVDLLAGVNSNNIGEDINLSPVYYYGVANNDTRALATNKNDSQFSDFVYWVVTATFHAEEEDIRASKSDEMPLVNVFGPKYSSMFRNAIASKGNYGEMYTRSLASIIPRTGRNLLNKPASGPQINPFVGFLKNETL